MCSCAQPLDLADPSLSFVWNSSTILTQRLTSSELYRSFTAWSCGAILLNLKTCCFFFWCPPLSHTEDTGGSPHVLSLQFHFCFVEVSLRADFLSLQKLLAAILFQKKSVMRVLAANVSMRVSIVKIVFECFLPWQESRPNYYYDLNRFATCFLDVPFSSHLSCRFKLLFATVSPSLNCICIISDLRNCFFTEESKNTYFKIFPIIECPSAVFSW